MVYGIPSSNQKKSFLDALGSNFLKIGVCLGLGYLAGEPKTLMLDLLRWIELFNLMSYRVPFGLTLKLT